MRTVIKIIMVIFIVLPLLSPLLSSPVTAIGLGIGPSELKITNALRGGEYERTITVFNPGKERANFTLGAEGEASDWISLYQLKAPDEPIESISIPGKGNAAILVKFNIPEDAASGIYTATIYAETLPGETTDTEVGAVTALRAPASVTIEVTGTQILTGVVGYITTRDTEVNYPLQIQVSFQNTGNVIAKPEIKTAITKNGTFIESFIHADTEIKPDALDTISVVWDTTGKESGDYEANVTVSLGGEVLSTQDLQFKLLPVGTLSRQGNLTDLSYDGKLSAGKTLKILATFRNTGEIDTKAMFIGEVYVDGDLIDTIESKELLVPVRETGTLTAYLKIEKDGSYVIKGHALYEGKTTETKEFSFDVGTKAETEPTSNSIPGFGAIGVIIAIASVMGYLVYRRRKSEW